MSSSPYDYINKPIYKNEYEVEWSGDLSIDMERIKKETKQSRQEAASYKLFADYYGRKTKSPQELVELFDKLMVFFKERPDFQNGWFDMYRHTFIAYLNRFNVIPPAIKERAREEFLKMKEVYEQRKAELPLKDVVSKPEK